MRLQVTAPARLHFGLMQIDPSRPNCFGGLGLMLPQPAACLRATTSDAFRVAIVDDEIRRRVEAASRSAAAFVGLPSLPTIEVSITNPLKLHNGLGVGTQLACAAATLIAACTLFPRDVTTTILPAAPLDAASVWSKVGGKAAPDAVHRALAAASGRGKRSHIGIQGFLNGGFLRDSGASPGTEDVPERRIESIRVPPSWRTILLISRTGQGPSGAAEQQAFDRSGHSSRSIDLRKVSQQMMELTNAIVIPSLLAGKFEAFLGSLAEYNELAGRLFDADAVADSPLASQMLRGREILAEFGLAASGQSSWGPTLWTMTDALGSIDLAALQKLLDEAGCDYDVLCNEDCSSGAILSIELKTGGE